jgi:DNA polymerase-4
MQNNAMKGKTVTIKVKFNDFKQITRSQTLDHVIDDDVSIMNCVEQLLDSVDLIGKKIRLLGIGVSNFEGQKPKPKHKAIYFDDGQLDLF